jgi:CHAD domain-containing protein
MTGKLKPDEPGTRGARRIARRRVKSALEILEGRGPTEHSVHAARKELKRARATLRLVRDALGTKTYKKENAALRDAARPLSEVRDAQVLLKALQALIERFGAPASRLPLGKFQRALNLRRRESRATVLKKDGPVKSAQKTLKAVSSRSEHWHVGRRGWSVLGAGLKRTYSQGRRAFAQARVKRNDESLHEWRKQIQHFAHQLQLFESLQARPLAELLDQTHKLADLLGDDHDLSVLRERAIEARDAFPTTAAHSALIGLIDRCRTGLQVKALRVGEPLYDEKPAEFTSRLGRYWHAWRHS